MSRKHNPMRLALIGLDLIRTKDPKISLGHASLLARLQRSPVFGSELLAFSHPFDIRDSLALPSPTDFEKYCDLVSSQSLSCDPDIIAIGAFIWNEAHIQQITKTLRTKLNYRGVLCLGGPQVTYAPAGTLEGFYPLVDYFIRGYGEDSFTKLIEFIVRQDGSLLKIEGVHQAGRFDEAAQSRTDLENLPSPFLESVIDLNRTFIRWETMRGCPFRCAFCQHRDSYSSRQKLAMERISSEIEAFCDRKVSRVNDIAVLDPTFNAGPIYLDVIDKFRTCGYTGKLALQTRIEMVNSDFMDRIERLQANGATVILECGVQTIHMEEMRLINRANNIKKIQKVAQSLKERAIPFEISIIYGLPKQSLETFQRTVDFCAGLKPVRVDAWPLMLLRGTELELRKQELELGEEVVLPNDVLAEVGEGRMFAGLPHVTSSPSFTRKDWEEMARIASELNK